MNEVKVFVKPDFVSTNNITKSQKKIINNDIITTFYNVLFNGEKPEGISTANILDDKESEKKFYGVTFEIKSGLDLTKLIIREWEWMSENEYLSIIQE